MEYTIEELNAIIEEIKKDVDSEKEMLGTGRMNIIELMNRHHLENQHSNVLSYLIAPTEEHNHPEYGEQFLKLLKTKFDEQNNKTKFDAGRIIEVKREDSTEEKRRIDILIKTENAFIIIENKIYASDQPEQMFAYINDIEKRDESGDKDRKIFCIYLTLTSKKHSQDSLTDKEADELSNYGGYLNLTYKDDILPWIKSLKTHLNETSITASLQLYSDILEGLTGLRNKYDENYSFVRKLYAKYFSLDIFNDKIMNIYQLNDSLVLDNENNKYLSMFKNHILSRIIYLNFLKALSEYLNKNIQTDKKFYFIRNFEAFGNDFSTLKKSFFDLDSTNFGLECETDNPDIHIYIMFENANGTSLLIGCRYSDTIKFEDLPSVQTKNRKSIVTENDCYNITFSNQDWVCKNLRNLCGYKRKSLEENCKIIYENHINKLMQMCISIFSKKSNLNRKLFLVL